MAPRQSTFLERLSWKRSWVMLAQLEETIDPRGPAPGPAGATWGLWQRWLPSMVWMKKAQWTRVDDPTEVAIAHFQAF